MSEVTDKLNKLLEKQKALTEARALQSQAIQEDKDRQAKVETVQPVQTATQSPK